MMERPGPRNPPAASDTVPIWATPGEMVMNVEAVELAGKRALDNLNRKGLALRESRNGYANGGLVDALIDKVGAATHGIIGPSKNEQAVRDRSRAPENPRQKTNPPDDRKPPLDNAVEAIMNRRRVIDEAAGFSNGGLIEQGLEYNRQALGLMGDLSRSEAERANANRQMKAQGNAAKWGTAGQAAGMGYMAYNSGLLGGKAAADVAGAAGSSLAAGSLPGAAAITPSFAGGAIPAAGAITPGMAGGMTGLNAAGAGLALSPTAATAGSAALTPGMASLGTTATGGTLGGTAATAATTGGSWISSLFALLL